jgi:hypothetical protein
VAKLKLNAIGVKKLLVGSQTTCRIILNLVQLARLEKWLPHHLFLLKNNSENSRSMSHHLSLLTNNSKNLRSMLHHLMPCHISPLILKKNQENYFIPRHISPLKNISKNSKNVL